MSTDNRNSNRYAKRLLFIFKLFAILVVFGAGIYFLAVPMEETESNQNMVRKLPYIGGFFIAYSLLRGYRLYREYQSGKYEQNHEE